MTKAMVRGLIAFVVMVVLGMLITDSAGAATPAFQLGVDAGSDSIIITATSEPAPTGFA